MTNEQFSWQELNRHTDERNQVHIRYQQTYAGYPVWSAVMVAHLPKATQHQFKFPNLPKMNGTAYAGLAKDLKPLPIYFTNKEQTEKALQHAVNLYQKQSGFKKYDITKANKQLLIYVDAKNKAHWAYYVRFLAAAESGLAVPTYILDAHTFVILAMWDDLQTFSRTRAGGFGGNVKTGRITYDDGEGNRPSLRIFRNDEKQICYLRDTHVVIKDNTFSSNPLSYAPIANFPCEQKDVIHFNLYWNGDLYEKYGAFSPENDALYAGNLVRNMYHKWYGVSPLAVFGIPLPIFMNIHARDLFGQVMDNAFYFSLTQELYFGDGGRVFYPLTSLDVIAHEVSHGLTAQYSNLIYDKQSGALNESFSDMASQAVQFYVFKQNSWRIAEDIMRNAEALRYMDEPEKDGKSISHVKQYRDKMNVHHASGVFNKLFYLLATSHGWNTKKAFNVMLKANMYYWTPSTNFNDAACGVLNAAEDNGYRTHAILKAIKAVGIKLEGYC